MNLDLAKLNPQVELTNPESLHGFRERYVASESLVYVVSQLQTLRKYLAQAISDTSSELVEDSFTQVNPELSCIL